MELETITLNGVEYVKKDSLTTEMSSRLACLDEYEYKIVRGDRSGVFAGYLKKLQGQNAEVLEARRIWYWEGAASLSQLAVDGTSKPEKCKFPEAVSKIILTDVVEVLSVTKKAKQSIESVEIWKA